MSVQNETSGSAHASASTRGSTRRAVTEMPITDSASTSSVTRITPSCAVIDEPEVTSEQERVKGFKAALASGCPNVKIVADVDGGGERAKASADMEDILQAHKDLGGVFGINDDSALGAAKAIDALLTQTS